MAENDKLNKKLNDSDYIETITAERMALKKDLSFELKSLKEPDNYVRERYTSRGKRFYNPKASIMETLKQEMKTQIPYEHKIYLEKLVRNKEAEYYVHLDFDFYVKIPKADSIKTTVLKEKKVIRPAISPDIDNFNKLIMDSLHDVLYDDDKRIVAANSNKYYSINPRTEIRVRFEIYKE